MVDEELYSGTSYNFLGSEPIISRHSHQSPLRTEYAIPWLNEPNFVFADVIRADQNSTDGEDDKIYFFFTEVSVEYECIGKLMIPRIARVCKRDQGGLRILQKKWTSFLKARLICTIPDKNLVFNVINDVFILKSPTLKEPVIYGVFTPQLNNVGLSAVCAYSLSTVEEVFSKGKYMQSAIVEQAHTKWVRYNGEIPNPRPGACINNDARGSSYMSSLNLPDKTLQFVRDHPLMDDSVTPMGDRPRLVKQDVKYTQIVVDRVRALNGTMYDVMFIGTDRGAVHKAISYENGMHIIEETQFFPSFEPVQTLLLSSKTGRKYLFAGSNSGVVQSPVAFCDKYTTCVDCVLARDPYCAWKPLEASCTDIFKEGGTERNWIQNIGGDASSCSDKVRENPLQHTFKHGSTAELKCSQKSNLAQVVWKFKDDVLRVESPKYRLLEKALLIFNLSEGDSGVYQCLSEEKVKNKKFSQVLAKHVLELKKIQHTVAGPTAAAAPTEGNSDVPRAPAVSAEGSAAHTSTTHMVPVTTARIVTKPIGPVLTSVASNTELFNSIPDAVPEKTMFLKSNDNFLLMFLFLFFFILFLCLLSYNCYKGYLPGQCLKFRSVMLLGKKKTKSDFSDCEQSVKETLVEQGSVSHQSGEQPKPAHDTGYETEPDCGNSQLQAGDSQASREAKDKPFDVKSSSPIPFPPTGTSFLSCVGSGSPPSPTSTQPDVWSSPDPIKVMLLPPFLSDQTQHVSVRRPFHLFCQATGPGGSYFVWRKKGQKMQGCLTEQSHVLLDGRVHVLSWVKDSVSEHTEYSCSFVSKAGNATSGVLITVQDKDSAGQDTWTKELDTWRSAISEHAKMMQNWKKTWVRIFGKDIPYSAFYT
ncbi:semaphorin-4D isoform X5 [Myiozetetes cayanensis]|nr:semaphorin-4D isoform X5 [Myiozetetes cayanensis]